MCKVFKVTWFGKSEYSFLVPLLEIFNDTNEGALFRAYEKWCDELSTGSLRWDLSSQMTWHQCLHMESLLALTIYTYVLFYDSFDFLFILYTSWAIKCFTFKTIAIHYCKCHFCKWPWIEGWLVMWRSFFSCVKGFLSHHFILDKGTFWLIMKSCIKTVKKSLPNVFDVMHASLYNKQCTY